MTTVRKLYTAGKHTGLPLSALATPHPHGLSVLLQLRDELVPLLDHIVVLLVLVVWAICLDDAVHAVDGTRDAVGGDEVR